MRYPNKKKFIIGPGKHLYDFRERLDKKMGDINGIENPLYNIWAYVDLSMAAEIKDDLEGLDTKPRPMI